MESLKLEIIGYTAGFLTTVCLVPQLWKILITKSVKGVSVWTYFVLLSGQILWIVYGTFVNDMRIIIPNVISATFCLLVIILYYYNYDNRNNNQN